MRISDWSSDVCSSDLVPVGTDLNVGVSGDVRYSSGYFISTNNSPYALQGGYVLADASIRLHNNAWDVSLIGKNLTNKIYGVLGTDKQLGPRGQVTGNIGRPREVIVQVTRHF